MELGTPHVQGPAQWLPLVFVAGSWVGGRWEIGALWGGGSPFSQKQENDKKEIKIQYFLD